MILKQKIFDELFIYNTKITFITAKICKIKNEINNKIVDKLSFICIIKITNEFDIKINIIITVKIKKIFSEINDKLTIKLNIKISNEFITYLF